MAYNKILFIFHVVCMFCFSSCSSYPEEVEKALSVLGNNRAELVRVLEHYRSNDRLKFKTACFLISNMPYHKSGYNIELPKSYFTYFKMVDSMGTLIPDANHNDSLTKVLGQQYASLAFPHDKVNTLDDIQRFTAEFLIENIDDAFYEWQHSPLLKSISFDDFKEWILPYRTVDEDFVGNKPMLRSIIYDKLFTGNAGTIYEVIENYKKYVRWQKEMNKQVISDKHIGPFDLFIPAFKMDCSNLAVYTCNYFRACGIPTVYEFTPQWPDKDSRHYWCASPDSTNVLQPYTPPYNNLLEDWPLDLKYVGKVYQRTFAAMKDSPYFLKNEDEMLPSVFDVPTIKDVTDRYHQCTEITIPMHVNTSNRLAYLSFFNTKEELSPVAWGKISSWKHSVTFKKIPFNMLFFPSYIAEDGRIVPFGKPFILRKDSITDCAIKEELKCDTAQTVRMHLLRKYPSKRHLVHDRRNLKDTRILGSDQWTGPYDTLYTICEVPDPYWQEYILGNNKKYRYYRLHRDSVPIDIAELEFLGEDAAGHNTDRPSALPVFKTNDMSVESKSLKRINGEPMHTGVLYYKAYDGNPETFARWGFFGMDFKQPVCITHIRLLPRTATNVIEPGCHYRLLYYQNNQWVEFKEVISECNFLDIDSVPANTIYWLMNLDKGKEELPFFYRNGRQVFINEFM